MSQKFRLLFIALGLSLTLTAGLMLHLQTREAEVPAKVQVEVPKILVFSRDLPAGHILAAGDFRWRALGKGPAPEGAVLKGEQSELDLIGAPLKMAVMLDQPVRAPLLGAKPNDTMLSFKVNPGYRAITINVDGAQLASGRVLPNDHVDILLAPGSSQGGGLIPMPTMPSSPSSTVEVTRLLDDVRIIAIGGATEPDKPETGRMETSMLKDATVTLELRPEDARRLLAASALGKIALLLRRPLEPDLPELPESVRKLRKLPPLPRPTAAEGSADPSAVPGLSASAPPAVLIVRGSN